jgi:ankyrin
MAQTEPAEITAVKDNDAAKLATLLTKDNLNNCYTEGSYSYSLLSQAVRLNARKCFDLLIQKGADVNISCDGYVPPLMHAAKYGRLDMVKILISKGANVNYKYDGEYKPAVGDTPLSYAIKYNQTAVADYLKSLAK